jgi:hypothetical protein
VSNAHCLIAYHGCDITVRDDLVRGRLETLEHSQNEYDWLGPGAYFFEGDVTRAVMFAEASHANPTKRYTRRPIATPAAVGAVLCVTSWLDMTTQEGITEFGRALDGLRGTGIDLPVNRAADNDDADIIYRALDSAVFSYMHQVRSSEKLSPYDAVRGAFPQGPEVATRSGFRTRTHVQIAVRNNACVVGWFLPKGAELLDDENYAIAANALAVAARAGKPRKRA